MWFGITALLTWLFCSLLQNDMFYEASQIYVLWATNFDQNLSRWDVSSGEIFVSVGLVLVLCSFLLEDDRFWNYCIADLVMLFIAAVSNVQRC